MERKHNYLPYLALAVHLEAHRLFWLVTITRETVIFRHWLRLWTWRDDTKTCGEPLGCLTCSVRSEDVVGNQKMLGLRMLGRWQSPSEQKSHSWRCKSVGKQELVGTFIHQNNCWSNYSVKTFELISQIMRPKTRGKDTP